jgi:O-antigen biosynthesis protein WbqP
MQELEVEMPSEETCRQEWLWPLEESASSGDSIESRRGFEIAKRAMDITVSSLALLLGFPFLAFLALLVRWSSPGPALFWSLRYGKYNIPFKMPKFRTMHVGAPEVPTVALESPEVYLTPVGSFLRKTSLDELPQMWSVLVGDMSLIGPRPVICAETELAERRAYVGVDQLTPGLTGWAQINGRDCVTIEEKVRLDQHYLEHRSVQLDHQIILETISRVLSREGIVH